MARAKDALPGQSASKMEDLVEDLSKKATRVERRLSENVPSEADVLLSRIKAELIELLRENAPKRLKRRSWMKKLVILMLVLIGAVGAVIAREARDIG